MKQVTRILLINDHKNDFIFTDSEFDDIFDEKYIIDRVNSYKDGLKIISEKKHDACLINCDKNSPSSFLFINEFVKNGHEFPLVLLNGTAHSESSDSSIDSETIDFPVKNSLNLERIKKAIQCGVQYLKDGKLNNSDDEHNGGVNERTQSLECENKKLKYLLEGLEKALRKELKINAMKSQLVTAAAHEFRTPLANILCSSSLVLKYNEDNGNDKIIKHINRIQSSVTNLVEVLNDYLSIGKLEEGVVRNNPETLQIEDFVNEVLSENMLCLKNGQKVNYKHLEGDVNISVDKYVFRNVIINLFSNAIKYSPEKKNIDITTKTTDQCLEFKIKDYGIGIPDTDQDKLFDRFFRAKNSVNIDGTGLGLNIVKKYIELMKGDISFSSKLNEGSEFIVKVPI